MYGCVQNRGSDTAPYCLEVAGCRFMVGGSEGSYSIWNNPPPAHFARHTAAPRCMQKPTHNLAFYTCPFLFWGFPRQAIEQQDRLLRRGRERRLFLRGAVVIYCRSELPVLARWSCKSILYIY